jgi:hypothetical protein
VSPVRYELGFYFSEDDIIHSHRSENLKSCIVFANLFTGQSHIFDTCVF